MLTTVIATCTTYIQIQEAFKTVQAFNGRPEHSDFNQNVSGTWTMRCHIKGNITEEFMGALRELKRDHVLISASIHI